MKSQKAKNKPTTLIYAKQETREQDPVANDLRDVVVRGYESKDLDYKMAMTWDEKDKKSCCELVKDILGMANTVGGYIVIGVSESPTGFTWNGVADREAGSFETTRLNRFLQNYVDPPINTVLRKILNSGKLFVVIGVPRFNDTPHICQKDYPGVLTAGALYVRTDNNETAQIRSSADFRSILECALRNRSDKLLASIQGILTTGDVSTSTANVERFQAQLWEAIIRFDKTLNPYQEKNYSGYREAAFYPTRFEAGRFTLDELRVAAEKANVDFRGWPFRESVATGLEVCNPGWMGRPNCQKF